MIFRGKNAADFLETPLKASDKIVYLSSFIEVLWSNQQNFGKFMHITCKEPMVLLNLVLYYPKDFFMIKAIDDKLNLMISAGLIEHWIKSEINLRFWKTSSRKRERKQLNYSHLSGAFWIFFIGCSVSINVFILELIELKLRSSLQKYFRK